MAEIASFGVNVDQNTRLAQNAQDTADDANAKNSANSQQIANINDPNYLSPFEKPQLQVQMDNFATLYTADKDIATAEGIDFTAYEAAYQAYLAYMTPLVANMTTYSPIVRSTFNSMVTAVQTEQKRFSTATQAQYNQQIKQAQTDIDDGQTKYQALQSDAETMKSSVAGVADTASRAISSAGFASDAASAASQAASSAVATANEAAAGATTAKTDAANALTSVASAINNAKSALSEAQSASEKYESLGMVKAWGNTSPQNQNMNNWIWSDPAKSAASITYANGVNAIDYTGVANYEVFNMPIHAKVGDKVSVTFAYTQPSVVSLDGSSNGVPVGFFDHPSKDWTIGANPIYLGVNTQSRKVYTISTTATSETMYLSFDFGFLKDGINWKFELSVQQDMTTNQPDTPSEYIGFSTKQSNNPADYTWLRNPDKLEGEVQQQITSINGELTSKVSQDTYDSLAGTVDQVSTLSKQNQSELVTKADSQAVDTLKQRVTTAENALTQTATKTELEQTNTDVDKLNNTVKSSSSEITAQAGKIDGLLNSTTDINGKLTTLQGNFDLSSQQLSTTMSKVDSMSIGGVNLLPDSDFESSITTELGTVNSGSYSFSKDYHYHGVQSLKISFASNISSADSGIILKIPNPQISTEYTTTGWLYSEVARTIVISNYSSTWTSLGRTNVQVPEKKWTKFVVHFKTTTITDNAGTAIFVNGVAGNDVQPFYLDCVQIEKGNVATDWSPAPEDLATVTVLTQVKQTADGAEALATNNQGNITSIQETAKGLQASVNSKASSDQLTLLSDQLTNKISDLSSSTSSQFTQTFKDINGLVKKGDVVNQFNLDAGGALLETTGNSTKIVFSSPNIIFDSKNPVQIPNANIPGKLTGKTFEAGTITATTKINGADIEAPLIHSPNDSFKLDGNTGDIVGASIRSADGAWGITANGKISGASVTSSLIDISGDGSGPNFDAENVTPDTATGIYSRYKYTNPNVGFDVNGMGRKMYKNGYLVINGDTFLNRTIGDWSADGGGKYVYDTMYEANVIKMRAYNYTGSDVQTDDPGTTQGVISSRVDIQPSAITMGPNFSVGNPNILIDYTGRIKGGLIAANAAHSIGTTDGRDLYFMQMNKDATNVGGSSIPIHVKKLYQSSLLSLKTDIKPIDPHEALTEVVKNDVMGYHFKNDKTTDPKSVSVILDDINPIPKYYTSDIFKSADGTGRNDGTIVGYLMLSIKDLNSRLQKLEGAS